MPGLRVVYGPIRRDHRISLKKAEAQNGVPSHRYRVFAVDGRAGWLNMGRRKGVEIRKDYWRWPGSGMRDDSLRLQRNQCGAISGEA